MNDNFPNNFIDTDVLIVGYGPVGAALAILLGQYGVRTMVLEKESDILMMPRAIALDNEALRILQMLGVDERAFPRVAIPEVRMHCPYTGQFGRVQISGSIDGHPKLVTFYQPDLERSLRDRVERLSSVSLQTNWEFVDLKQDAVGVRATVRDHQGALCEVRAEYLVGADGASSSVRSLIGQNFQGRTYAEEWLIVDAMRKNQPAIDHIEFKCDPARPVVHMPAPGGRERWEFMLNKGETREQMEQNDNIAELLKPWGDAAKMTIERKAVYRFHARCCDRFQKGRVFLVGDAAHITPPFVGQGLVAGLRDVANLGWKLAWVVQSRASQKLLNSYDIERRPHASRMIDLARLMGRMVMPNNALSAIAIHGFVRLARLSPGMRSYLDDLKIKPANRFSTGFFISGRSRQKLIRGGQLPQGLVRPQGGVQLSDELQGSGFTLIGIGVDPQLVLSMETRKRWQAFGGSWLHISQHGQVAETVHCAEDLVNTFIPNIDRGWLIVARPDRVIMHDGPTTNADELVDECLVLAEFLE